MRPDGAELRVVAATDRGRLVGIAPLWLVRDPLRGPRYRVIAGGLSAPVGPLAESGREREVALVIASALSEARPPARELGFEGHRGGSSWPLALAEAWPGRRPWIHSVPPVASPTVCLQDLSYEQWLGGKTQNFRQQARRFRRRLERDGARFEIAGPDGIDMALNAFVELHGERWSARGGSNALVEGISPMLTEVARELAPSGRFRVATIELEGRLISVHLFLAAGGEVSYWNGGFDERWEHHKPSLQALLFAIADSMERGDRRMDLGPGAQDYKQRLADDEDVVDTLTLVPRGLAYPLSRLRLAPHQARWGLSRRLSPDVKRRLRAALQRRGNVG
ncbi:MAG: GNAT family N-acetyltransferase [Thermoleophilaceae bacterium]